MRSGKGLQGIINDGNSDSLSKKSLKKSRVKNKRNVSLILPRLDTQSQNI
jgi:hypothetical protein